MSALHHFAQACALRFVLRHLKPGAGLPIVLGYVGPTFGELAASVKRLANATAALDAALLEFDRRAMRRRRKPPSGQFKRRGRKLGVLS